MSLFLSVFHWVQLWLYPPQSSSRIFTICRFRERFSAITSRSLYLSIIFLVVLMVASSTLHQDVCPWFIFIISMFFAKVYMRFTHQRLFGFAPGARFTPFSFQHLPRVSFSSNFYTPISICLCWAVRAISLRERFVHCVGVCVNERFAILYSYNYVTTTVVACWVPPSPRVFQLRTYSHTMTMPSCLLQRFRSVRSL